MAKADKKPTKSRQNIMPSIDYITSVEVFKKKKADRKPTESQQNVVFLVYLLH